MPDAKLIDIAGPKHVAESPIIDFLAYDANSHSYVVEFVPESQVSSERKESLYIPDKIPMARRVAELLAELAAVLNAATPIVRIAHGGGGDFDLQTQRGDLYRLHGSRSPTVSFDVYAVLHALSQEVQVEFIAQRRKQNQRAAV